MRRGRCVPYPAGTARARNKEMRSVEEAEAVPAESVRLFLSLDSSQINLKRKSTPIFS